MGYKAGLEKVFVPLSFANDGDSTIRSAPVSRQGGTSRHIRFVSNRVTVNGEMGRSVCTLGFFLLVSKYQSTV